MYQFISENDVYSAISGVVVFVSRWMLFVSFLRHSPSHFPEGNLVYCILCRNYCGQSLYWSYYVTLGEGDPPTFTCLVLSRNLYGYIYIYDLVRHWGGEGCLVPSPIRTAQNQSGELFYNTKTKCRGSPPRGRKGVTF